MYQALYRKYRPSTFEDVCGHEHITSVLQSQVRDSKTSHAYLFCGTRGTGKTSCAKILAKAVNCQEPQNGSPCNRCPACLGIDKASILDVVEMDAASNNSVENIRKLCDDVQYLPTEVNKRVYIIDEVHMLSVSAFNALLKTLEEPPEHVLFILATTDINKVPATIVSRCQRFDFRRIKPAVIIERLMHVAALEGMELDRDAASIIAKIADGGMRDALSLLEACTMVKGIITPEEITRILGLSDREVILDLIEACAAKNPARTIHLTDELYQKTGDFKEVIAEILKLYRDLMVLKFIPTPDSFLECYQNEAQRLAEIASSMTKDVLLYHIDILEELFSSYDRITSGKKASVEIAFLKLCFAELSDSNSALAARIGEIEKRIADGASLASCASVPPSEEKAKPSAPKEKISRENTVTPVGNTASSGESTPDYIPDLLIRMQEESLIRPYLKQVRFQKQGDTFFVVASGFIKGILETTSCDTIVKRHVTVLDPQIKNVVITESVAANGEKYGDLDSF